MLSVLRKDVSQASWKEIALVVGVALAVGGLTGFFVVGPLLFG